MTVPAGKALASPPARRQTDTMADRSLRRRTFFRLLPLLILLSAGALFVALGGGDYLSFASLAAHHAWLAELVARRAVAAAAAFILSYAGLVALSVPGAALMTIAGGFLFGTCLGATYAAVAATLGATAIFLAARVGLAGLLTRARPRWRRIESGFRANAFSYLLVLRLVPVVPFWLVNLVAGATGMRLSTYLAATLLGIVPASFVYASLGSGLGSVLDENGVPDLGLLYRPGILLPILGLALLALLPVAYRRWRARDFEPRPAPPQPSPPQSPAR
jgi:uncharacterized membrane protein YdjX (TVP38/TMEM64 family)